MKMNVLETGNTLFCDKKIKYATSITMHVVPRKHDVIHDAQYEERRVQHVLQLVSRLAI